MYRATILILSFVVFSSVQFVCARDNITSPIRPHNIGGLPEYYPGSFDFTGVLQKIEKNGREVVINAQLYRFDSNTEVHTLSTNFGVRNDLKESTEVGFSVKDNVVKPAIIDEIWVLPEGSIEQY